MLWPAAGFACGEENSQEKRWILKISISLNLKLVENLFWERAFLLKHTWMWQNVDKINESLLVGQNNEELCCLRSDIFLTFGGRAINVYRLVETNCFRVENWSLRLYQSINWQCSN